MQPAHGAGLEREGDVVLDELQANSARGESGAVVDLAKIAAFVAEHLGLDDLDFRKGSRLELQHVSNSFNAAFAI